jgi:zinc D-Ala-D-Ala carboxypeptidase
MSYTSKYFRINEIICKCGECGTFQMSDNALYMFDRIRELYGKPMIVASGCRCKEHNKKVGGSDNSAHVPDKRGLCYALDIKCENSGDRHNLIKAAISLGCVRWAYTKTFVHLDFSPNLPQNKVWAY